MAPSDQDQELRLGGGAFYGVPFPIAIGDRYVHLRVDDGDPICQIWRWDCENRKAVREPDPGEKASAGLTLTAGADPGSLQLELSQSAQGQFGGFAGADGLRVVLTPNSLEVWQGASAAPSAIFGGTILSGSPVGVHIKSDGVRLGTGLPDGFTYHLDYAQRRIQISRMVRALTPWIENTRFVNCEIEGPAVLVATDTNVVMSGGRWGNTALPQPEAFIDLPPEGSAAGLVQLRNVTFEDCVLLNIAIARTN